MTPEQILKKAIEKAVENGYKPAWWECSFNVIDPKDGGAYFSEEVYLADAQEKLAWHKKTFGKSRPAKLGIYPKMSYYFQIIFSHPFAEAFIRYVFKKHKYNFDNLMYYYEFPADIEKAKQVFLQQMVLEEEPLKYLEKFLEEK